MIARLPGATIAYDDVGDGPPIVFLHAFPLDRAMWDPQVSALAHRARCIAPDLPGFGGSSSSRPPSMEQWADDVAALLDHLDVRRAVIAGLSMGGYVALALWRRHPERVRALVLADTRADADSPDARERRRELIALAEREGSAAVAARQLTGLIGRSTRERAPALVEHVRRLLERAPVPGIVGALQGMMARPDATTTLATISVPTLVVTGDEDVLTPPRDGRRMHERIPQSDFELLAGAGHLSSLERPAAFNHLLGELLGRLDGT